MTKHLIFTLYDIRHQAVLALANSPEHITEWAKHLVTANSGDEFTENFTKIFSDIASKANEKVLSSEDINGVVSTIDVDNTPAFAIQVNISDVDIETVARTMVLFDPERLSIIARLDCNDEGNFDSNGINNLLFAWDDINGDDEHKTVVGDYNKALIALFEQADKGLVRHEHLNNEVSFELSGRPAIISVVEKRTTDDVIVNQA